MAKTIPNIVDDLVDEEISRIVADAIKGGTHVSTLRVRAKIAKMFPSRRYSEHDLSARLMLAARRHQITGDRTQSFIAS